MMERVYVGVLCQSVFHKDGVHYFDSFCFLVSYTVLHMSVCISVHNTCVEPGRQRLVAFLNSSSSSVPMVKFDNSSSVR